MKVANTLTLKNISLSFIETNKSYKTSKKDNRKEIKNSSKPNQNNTPKEIRRGINMTDEQRDIAQKIKNDIVELYFNEGYSIRMITAHYNDLYSIRNKKGDILKEAISRETVRKILNEEEVSLKTIIGIIGNIEE